MSNAPAFASTPLGGAALLGTAETSLTVPAQSSQLVAPGATGGKIEEIVVHAATTSLAPTTVAGNVYIFLFDGATYHLYDTIPVTVVAPSATVAPFRTRVLYANLIIPANWTLRASQSIAGNANILKVTALGGTY